MFVNAQIIVKRARNIQYILNKNNLLIIIRFSVTNGLATKHFVRHLKKSPFILVADF